MVETTYQEITASDFFYRNRDIAGFTNPTRAIFAATRELVENSLDAAEISKIPPDIYIRFTFKGQASKETKMYRLRVADNGIGVPPNHIPSAFGQVLYGSKYKLKQQRGTFGLGGKMAILYGQITTHQPATIISSTGKAKIFKYKLLIDIEKNRPIILERKVLTNNEQWHGTIVDFSLEGDYLRAMPRLLEYFKQTAMVNPYANLTFIDPKGRLYKFQRVTKQMPDPPKETLPHPYGVDVELLQRLIMITKQKNMLDFLTHHFHRVGEITAKKFLEYSKIKANQNPKKLTREETVNLMQTLRNFNEFLPPDASCLSPLGEELLKAGIFKELNPEFVAVSQRKPATYSGNPFIIEVGIAYGGKIPNRGGFVIYRFANRIPLIYDEANDVSVKVLNSMNWRRYKVTFEMPVSILIHICSTKIPYKTVGKEYISDRPEVKREMANGMREVARQLQHFLTKREHVDRERKRFNVFNKYLPRIAQFSAKLAEKDSIPNLDRILRSAQRFGTEKK